jgi:hypothetical protein
MANKLQTNNENEFPLFTVTFTWKEGYEKSDGINHISMNVRAETNFKALDVAWELIKVLNLIEPSSFNAQKAR